MRFLWLFLWIWPLFGSQRVTAVMVTGKDSFHYPLAIGSILSFMQQTYPNKRLLIINDGDYSFPFLEKGLIEEIRPKGKLPLGALRNLGLDALEEDEVWIQWDDDDWRHPDMIQMQYDVMQNEEVDAVLLMRQVRYSFQKNTAWDQRMSRGIPGTVMARKHEGVSYPEKALDEDSGFWSEYQRRYRIHLWHNEPHLYLRFIHGKNSWDTQHFRLDRRPKNGWLIDQNSKDYLQRVLEYYRWFI